MKVYNYSCPQNFCKFYPLGYFECINGKHYCGSCSIANKYRAKVSESISFELFGPQDALPLTPKGCDNFVDKLLVLKPDTLKQLSLPQNALFQFVMAEPSPGCFKDNPTGFIDCILFADRSRSFTIYRNDVYGVPTSVAMARYNNCFIKAIDHYCNYS